MFLKQLSTSSNRLAQKHLLKLSVQHIGYSPSIVDKTVTIHLGILNDCKKTCFFFSTASITNFFIINHYTNLDWDFLQLDCQYIPNMYANHFP